MDQFAQILRATGFCWAKLEPLLITELHLIISAVFPIYTGAHASLSRPSSAAKPPKRKGKSAGGDDHEADEEPKMEGLTPTDAIMLPIFAGATLAGLYFLIKWLEDPALLNRILNWYFSLFGLLAVARLLTDSMSVLTSFIFPDTYERKGRLWKIEAKARKAKASGVPSEVLSSPLPGLLSTLPLPTLVEGSLWNLRELPYQKARIRAYLRGLFKIDVKIGPQGLLSLIIALAAELYFNLVDKPWWLTNLLGFSLVYSTLQIITPTTPWTGTLILSGLFFYDIYMVFFTPLMVTVATKLDIPAKLLFPRPARPDEDPAKQAMSMLGLGDLVLPGMMIGFALRFDMYLFYLRKQTTKVKSQQAGRQTRQTIGIKNKGAGDIGSNTVKAKWQPATGKWGERFWTPKNSESPTTTQGGVFSKTYFKATMIGYVVGMLCTLAIMQTYGHAQPALLYLVPGVLGALWGTAFLQGDVKTLWDFTEAEEEEERGPEDKRTEKGEKKGDDWSSWGFIGRLFQKVGEDAKETKLTKESSEKASTGHLKEAANDSRKEPIADARNSRQDERKELMNFSISLPVTALSDNKDRSTTSKQVKSSRKRSGNEDAKPETEIEDEKVSASSEEVTG